jgi:hypothetical protein
MGSYFLQLQNKHSACPTAQRHSDNILYPYMHNVIDRQSQMFQRDNARSHTTRVIMAFLVQYNIDLLPFTSTSPDFNLTELWDELDRRVRQRQPTPQSLDQLSQALQHE